MLKNFLVKWYFHSNVDFTSNVAEGLNLQSTHRDLNTIILQGHQLLLFYISTAHLVTRKT